MSTSHIGARKFSLADIDPSLKYPSAADADSQPIVTHPSSHPANSPVNEAILFAIGDTLSISEEIFHGLLTPYYIIALKSHFNAACPLLSPTDPFWRVLGRLRRAPWGWI